jgi:hypothetical protein
MTNKKEWGFLVSIEKFEAVSSHHMCTNVQNGNGVGCKVDAVNRGKKRREYSMMSTYALAPRWNSCWTSSRRRSLWKTENKYVSSKTADVFPSSHQRDSHKRDTWQSGKVLNWKWNRKERKQRTSSSGRTWTWSSRAWARCLTTLERSPWGCCTVASSA